MDPIIKTLAEHGTELERIAIARHLCRFGRYPTADEVAAEKRKMARDAVQRRRSRTAPAIPPPGQAAAWLRGKGLDVPASEIEED